MWRPQGTQIEPCAHCTARMKSLTATATGTGLPAPRSALPPRRYSSPGYYELLNVASAPVRIKYSGYAHAPVRALCWRARRARVPEPRGYSSAALYNSGQRAAAGAHASYRHAYAEYSDYIVVTSRLVSRYTRSATT